MSQEDGFPFGWTGDDVAPRVDDVAVAAPTLSQLAVAFRDVFRPAHTAGGDHVAGALRGEGARQNLLARRLSARPGGDVDLGSLIHQRVARQHHVVFPAV